MKLIIVIKLIRRALAAALLWALPVPALAAGLKAFVAARDQSFKVEVIGRWTAGEVDFAQVDLTSQTFKGTPWQHRLTLAYAQHRPKQPTAEVLLLITGGQAAGSSRASRPAAERLQQLSRLALGSGHLVAVLEQVPFQPIFTGKLEDAAIAYTLTQFFATGDDSWPLLQPMVKSVVRAMDAVAKVAPKEFAVDCSGFVLSGASKRGWTTWLTAAIDSRVQALAPMVFDIVHMLPQLQHQKDSWGAYSEEIGDYSEQGLPAMLATPRGAQLLALIDPYSYRETLTQPKLIVLGTNDRYWPVDAAQLYLSDLPGQTYLLYRPNAGHDDTEGKVLDDDRMALTKAAAGELRLPVVTASYQTLGGKGVLDLHSDRKPVSAQLWQARAATRDFRSARWQQRQELPPEATLQMTIDAPPTGYVASYLEVVYDLNGRPFTISTPVGITASLQR